MKTQTRGAISVRGATYVAVRNRARALSMSMSEYVEQAIAAELKRCGYFEGSFRCGAQAGETGMCGSHVGMVSSTLPIARAVAEVVRRGDRQVERAAAAVVAALPRESKIVTGPPPEQTAMLGRQETPLRSMAPACPCCGRQSMRAGVRCGVCAIACTRLGEGWKRGKLCPARAPMVDLEEPVEGEADEDLSALDDVPPKPARGSAWRGRMAPRPEEAEARRAARTAAPPPISEGSDRPVTPGRPAGLRVEAAKARGVDEVKRIAKVDPIAAVHEGRSGVQF